LYQNRNNGKRVDVMKPVYFSVRVEKASYNKFNLLTVEGKGSSDASFKINHVVKIIHVGPKKANFVLDNGAEIQITTK